MLVPGLPIRAGNGTNWPSVSCAFCGRPAIIGVAMMPGAIVLTRMPVVRDGYSELASERASQR